MKMKTSEFEIWQNDEMVASTSGPHDEALHDALHYITQYQQDGDVELVEVTRTTIYSFAHKKEKPA